MKSLAYRSLGGFAGGLLGALVGWVLGGGDGWRAGATVGLVLGATFPNLFLFLMDLFPSL